MRSAIVFLLLLSLVPPLLAEENVYALSAEQWARPRQGDALVTYPSLNAAIGDWMRSPGRIQVRYPGGEEGSLWGEELRDWLVALGIPARAIELAPGSRDPETVELIVSSGKERRP